MSQPYAGKAAEQSALIGLPTAPPAYNEPPAAVQQPNVVQPPVHLVQQPIQTGHVQYPQQVQVGGVLPPQAWPQGQGYPVSSCRRPYRPE